MTIDLQHFTLWASLAGGALIGLAAAMLMVFNGRVAGISGIMAGLLKPKSGDIHWRMAFILGLILAPWAWQLFAPLPNIEINVAPPVLILAGLLVGIGTRYGSGCTSGHGVCGLARFSVRSLIATLCFMAAGFATVYIMRHVLGA